MPVIATLSGGVPAFVADEDGAARAALAFRVGTSDERLVESGVTHVVEHLAMHALGRTPHDSNAFVDALRTVFWATGTPDEVRGFLREVCAALHQLPVDRLDLERRVLLTEAARRRGGAHDELLTYRFGPRSYGVRAYGELGLRRLQPDAVAEWAATRFTAGNAALWSTFPLDDLELPLPSGPRLSAVEPHSVDPLPGRFPGRSALGLDAVVPRSVAVTTAWQILRHRIYDALRVEQAVIYDVAIDTERVGRDGRRLVLLTDPLPEVTYRAGQLLTRVLEQLQQDGVTTEEVDRERTAALRAWEQPGTDAALADIAVLDTLVGMPAGDGTAIRAEQEALTTDDVTSALRDALTTALVSVPDQVVTTLPLGHVARWSRSWEQGRVFLPAPQLAQSSVAAASRRLVIGERGVTLSASEREPVTVRYAECEAVLSWDDGSRRLMGTDGFQIAVLPWEWQDGLDAVDLLGRSAPADRVVPMGAGDGPPDLHAAPPALPALPARRQFSSAWWFLAWAVLSLIFVPFALTPVTLPPQSPQAVYDHLQCGRDSSLDVVLHGPGPATTAVPPLERRALHDVCINEARFDVGLSGAGVLSFMACVVVAGRRVHAAVRARRHRAATPG